MINHTKSSLMINYTNNGTIINLTKSSLMINYAYSGAMIIIMHEVVHD